MIAKLKVDLDYLLESLEPPARSCLTVRSHQSCHVEQEMHMRTALQLTTQLCLAPSSQPLENLSGRLSGHCPREDLQCRQNDIHNQTHDAPGSYGRYLWSCSTDSRYQRPLPRPLHRSTRIHSLQEVCL